MGVIFRNGRPFGAAAQDVTMVTNYSDLEELTNKTSNHIYVTTSDSKSYYYDVNTQTFEPLTSDMTIPGAKDQLVAADGNGNAKANAGMFYSKYDSSNYHSILQSPTPFVTIKSSSSTTENYWDSSHPLTLNMEHAPLLQFIGSNQYGSPVLSMNGRGVVDIFGGRAGNYNPVNTTRKCSYDTNYISYQAYNYYNGVYSPFDTTKKLCEEELVYPLLQFKDSSTVLMEGCSLIHMSGGSSLFMDGNADVRINGSYVNHGNEYQNWGRTYVDINPGSRVILTSSYRGGGTQSSPTDYVPLISMTCGGVDGTALGGDIDGQLILSCQESPTFSTGSNLYSSVAPSILKFSGMNNALDFVGNNTHGSSSYHYVRNHLTTGDGNTSGIINQLSNVRQPSIMLQGRSHFCVGDQGIVGVKMAASSGGAIAIDWTSQGVTGMKIGSGSGALGFYEFTPNPGSRTRFKFSPDSGASTAIAIEPSGIFSLKIDPGAVCGIGFTSRYTDIAYQWQMLDCTINSNDAYAEIGGFNRVELRDETIIHMKGSSHKSDQRYRVSTYTGNQILFQSTTNYDGMTIEDLSSTDFDAFNTELAKQGDFSQTKWYYESGGTITSQEYYPDKYAIVVEGFSKTFSGSNTFTVSSKDYYSSITSLQNSTDYQDSIASKYGANATVSGASIRNRQYSYGYYYYYLNGTISNARCSANCTTQYALDIPYADLASTDKTKFDFNSWTSTNAKVIENNVRWDMKYYNYVTNFTYRTATQNGEDWAAPIQQREKGPVFQMYDRSNICMRNKDVNSSAQFTYMLNDPVETYDFTQSQYEVITQFLNSADYTTFLANVSFNIDNNLSEIISLAEGDVDNPGTKLFITYTQKWEDKENHVIGNGTDPVIEMTGGSELRLYNGATIKAITEWDKTTITFSGTADEGEVSFTIDELRDLKRMISATPTVVVNDSSEMTENDTLYFLNE